MTWSPSHAGKLRRQGMDHSIRANSLPLMVYPHPYIDGTIRHHEQSRRANTVAVAIPSYAIE